MGNLTIASNHHVDGMVATNEDVFEENLTVLSNKNSIVAGPVTIPNVTISLLNPGYLMSCNILLILSMDIL